MILENRAHHPQDSHLSRVATVRGCWGLGAEAEAEAAAGPNLVMMTPEAEAEAAVPQRILLPCLPAGE
jgi:hypothetical protein